MNAKIKEKILDEIMDLMDETEGKKLMNHPKLVAMKVTATKPAEEMPTEEKESDGMEMDDEMDDEMLMELVKAAKKKK